MTTSLSPIGLDTMSSALHEAEHYHRWMFEWIRPFISGSILDIGGGTGNHLKYLEQSELCSVDISEDCIAFLKKKFTANPRWHFIRADATKPDILQKLAGRHFDTILSCNVFEHLEDDRGAFKMCSELLAPGGRIVLILPAHGALFGDMDRLAGHFRRYDIAMAADRLREAGLSTVRLRYVNAFGAVGWYVNNRFFKHDNLSSSPINWQIKLFDRFFVPILRFIEGDKNMPFGQSLICVGRKN